MGLIYKYEDGDSVTKKMVNRNKPKENKTISKSERSNSESTSVSKPLVKSLKVLAIEKMMRDEKEQPVISQGRKLTEQEQKTSDKINKRLENKAKYKNEPGIVNDFLNVTGIDPTDIGMTAGNIAKKISNLGGEGLTEEDIIKTTNNPKEALKFADNIAKQEAINLIAGNILAAPLGRAYYNTASSINKYVKNPFPSIRNFKKLHPLVTNSRLLDPALTNKLIRKYPQISGDIVGNTTADIGDNIVKKLNTELSEAEFNPNKILDKAKQSAEKSELLERFSESVPQKKDALNELKLIKDIQSNLKHAEVESSMGDHIAKVHGKYYDTNKLSTEEYDLLEKAALNSPEQLAAYHTSYTPKETDMFVNRFGDKPKLTKNNFYTKDEVNKLSKQYIDYHTALNEYEKLNPQDPGSMIMGALKGQNTYMDKFHNLYPNLKDPNWGEKFWSHLDDVRALNKELPYAQGVKNSLSPNSLKFINSNENKLLPSAKPLTDQSNDWFHKASKKDYLIEMRGSLNIKPSDIKKMSKSEIEFNAQKIYDKIKQQEKERYLKDVSNIYEGKEAIKNVSSNKKGGLIYKK
jgi:hypothetical protein